MSQDLAAAFMSAIPLTGGFTYGNVHLGPGVYSKQDDGMGVGYEFTGLPARSSLQDCWASDAIWALRYRLLNPIPSGTIKLVLVALANENSVVCKVEPKWICVPMGQDPSSTALVSEGIQTVTWGAADANVYKETKITLDAGSLIDGSMLVLELCFKRTGWTMTKTSTWLLPLILVEN